MLEVKEVPLWPNQDVGAADTASWAGSIGNAHGRDRLLLLAAVLRQVDLRQSIGFKASGLGPKGTAAG